MSPIPLPSPPLITPSGNCNTFQIGGRSNAPLPVDDYDIVNKLYVDTLGAGYVKGPSSSVANTIPLFADTTGKLLSDSTLLVTSGNQLSNLASISLKGTTNSVTISPVAATSTYSLVLPSAQGSANTFLRNDGSGNLDWATLGGSGGNVTGPLSSTINAIALYFNTTGTIIKNSTVLVSSSGDITGVASLALKGTTNSVTISPTAATASYSLVLPAAQGSANTYLQNDGAGNLSWTTAANYVTGPASATDNAIARFDLTTGKVIQNSNVTVSDTAGIAGVKSLAFLDSTTGTLTVQPASTTTSYTLTMPSAQATSGVSSALVNNGSGILSWSPTGVLPPSIIVQPTTYALQASDQSKIFIYTTGGGTINFTNGSLFTGFYCYVKNGSSGDITLQFNGVDVNGTTPTLHRSTGSNNSSICLLYYNGTTLTLY